MRAIRHRTHIGPLLCFVAAGLVGGYLLAWAARWPHSDMRSAWAILLGGTLVLCAVVTLLVQRLLPKAAQAGLAVLALIGVLVGGFALHTVTVDQRHACGDVLDACDSLLPGP